MFISQSQFGKDCIKEVPKDPVIFRAIAYLK